jgi:hypothetical protein
VPNTTEAALRIVRERISAADQLRRGRDASRLLWKAAPIVAAGGVSVALAARWAGWSPAIPLVGLGLGALALAVFVLIRRRSLPVSDSAASAVDADAGLRGELRSANWFLTRDRRDEWADYHLLQAADTLQDVNWPTLYPPPLARRAQLATAVLVAVTIALAVTIPEHVGVPPTAAAAAADAPADPKTNVPTGRLLDPELQKQLEALLAAAARGELPTADALANDVELRDMLNKLSQLSDADLIEALKRALASNATADPNARAELAAENLKRLAEQAKRTPADVAALPKELQDALDKLSDQIELAKPEGSKEEAAAASAEPSEGEVGEGSDGASEELSIQFSKAAEPGGAAGVMMMASPDAAKPGGPGSGVGGAGSDDLTGSSAAALEAALKKETVEASQDSPGKNVETELRRKTEHGNATVAFTGSQSAQFDRTRAGAPPPVPEARRTGVQTYFVRKPQ